MTYKQVIIVRQDLKLPKGKIAAQAGHACVEATLRAMERKRETVRRWRHDGMKKIALKVPDERTLLRVVQQAKDAGLTTAIITDAGRTIVEPGTRTCAAIGPDDEDRIDAITKDIQLL